MPRAFLEDAKSIGNVRWPKRAGRMEGTSCKISMTTWTEARRILTDAANCRFLGFDDLGTPCAAINESPY